MAVALFGSQQSASQKPGLMEIFAPLEVCWILFVTGERVTSQSLVF